MSLVRNSSIMIVAVVLANLLAYGFHLVAGRYLGPSGYGQLGVLISFFTLAGIPFDGLSWSMTKILGNTGDQPESHPEIIRAFVLIGFRSFLLYVLVLLLSAVFFADKLKIHESASWYVLAIMFAFFTLYWLISALLRSRRDFRKLSTAQVIESVGRFLILLVFILIFSPDPTGVLLAFAFGYLIPGLFFPKDLKALFSSLHKQITFSIPRAIRNKWVYYAGLISLKNLILVGLTNFSVLIVNQWMNNEEVGHWNAALTIARINQFVAAAISTVLFAEAVNTKSQTAQKDFAVKSTLIYGILATGIVLLFFMVPNWLILPLFGKSFEPAKLYLPWIGIGTAVLGMIQIWADYLLARVNISVKMSDDNAIN